ncbi:hypothetical protein VM98_35215, partial [Streptomyces rubellomurinus subsp. indigoferus]
IPSTQGKAEVKMYVTSCGANDYVKAGVTNWRNKADAKVSIKYYVQPGRKHLTSDFKNMIPDPLQWLTKQRAGPPAH